MADVQLTLLIAVVFIAAALILGVVGLFYRPAWDYLIKAIKSLGGN